MAYLGELVVHPAQPISALTLAGGAAGGQPRHEIIDRQAREAYAVRARELAGDLAEAEADNDLGRADRIRVELDAVVAQIEEAAGLGGRVVTPPAGRGRHIYNQYCIRAARRDELRAFLAEQGVGTEIYYPLALHMQECFAYLGHEPGDFPESLRAAQESLALPIYPELTEDQLQYVVDSIARFERG